MDNTNKRKKIKEIAYGFLSKFGIKVFQKVFPEHFAKEPLKPTDRYIEYPFVVRNLPKPPARILDVGCAGSYFPLLLAGFGYETYGMDIRKYAIINKIDFKNFKFIKADIRKTSFADNYFDAASAISTIEHIGLSGRHGSDDDPDGDKAAIEEIKRIVKPGGVILLTVPFGKAKIIKPDCRIYDYGLIKKLINGLKIEKEEYYLQDKDGDWYKCPKEEAEIVDARGDYYSLGLLKIINK